MVRGARDVGSFKGQRGVAWGCQPFGCAVCRGRQRFAACFADRFKQVGSLLI